MAHGSEDYYSPFSQLADVINAMIGSTEPHVYKTVDVGIDTSIRLLEAWTGRTRAVVSAGQAGNIYVGVDSTTTNTKNVARILSGTFPFYEFINYRGEIWAYGNNLVACTVAVAEW